MIRKLLTTTTLTGALALALAAPAAAQDCFNASRSAQGNTSAAAHAATWWGVPEILADLGGLTPDQIEKVLPVIAGDPRVPANFTVFYNPAHPGELASKMPANNATHGPGI